MIFKNISDSTSHAIDLEKMQIEDTGEVVEKITFHDYETRPSFVALPYLILSIILIFTWGTDYGDLNILKHIALVFYIATFLRFLSSTDVQYIFKTDKRDIKVIAPGHHYFKMLNALEEKEKRDKGKSIEKEYWGFHKTPKNRHKSPDVK